MAEGYRMTAGRAEPGDVGGRRRGVTLRKAMVWMVAACQPLVGWAVVRPAEVCGADKSGACCCCVEAPAGEPPVCLPCDPATCGCVPAPVRPPRVVTLATVEKPPTPTAKAVIPVSVMIVGYESLAMGGSPMWAMNARALRASLCVWVI